MLKTYIRSSMWHSKVGDFALKFHGKKIVQLSWTKDKNIHPLSKNYNYALQKKQRELLHLTDQYKPTWKMKYVKQACTILLSF